MRTEGGSGWYSFKITKMPRALVIDYVLDSWLDSISFFPEPACAQHQQTELIVSHRAAGQQHRIVCACPCKLRAFLCMLVPLQLSQIPLAWVSAY